MQMYFQNHHTIVKTDYPIMKILVKPDLTEWMIGWTIELSEFHIQYQPRGAIKSQTLANFIVELSPWPTEDEDLQWILHVDGSSNDKSCGGEVVLEGLSDILLEKSLKFDFKTSNNQVEYEVIFLVHDMEAQQLICRSDSQLVVRQVKGELEVKESLLQKYYHLVRNMMSKFKNF